MTVREALQAIAFDMKFDARTMDGREFNGRNVAEYLGNQAAAIARLAEIVAEFLPEEEPERDPVPYKDFLPAMDASESLGIHPAMPGSPAVAGDLYERDDVETDDGLPSNAEGHVLHGAITDRPVQP